MCREFDEALDARRRRPGCRASPASARAVDGDDRTDVVDPAGLARVQAFLEAISLVTDLDDRRRRDASRARSR